MAKKVILEKRGREGAQMGGAGAKISGTGF